MLDLSGPLQSLRTEHAERLRGDSKAVGIARCAGRFRELETVEHIHANVTASSWCGSYSSSFGEIYWDQALEAVSTSTSRVNLGKQVGQGIWLSVGTTSFQGRATHAVHQSVHAAPVDMPAEAGQIVGRHRDRTQELVSPF